MQREIKFRAWDIYKKVFIPKDTWAVINSENESFAIMVKDWEDYREGEVMYPNTQILMQYTGLTDKNGKEIYEGDVILYTDVYSKVIHTVIFSNGKFIANNRIRPLEKLWLSDNGKSYDLCFLIRFNEYEIIGNIYENKELLNSLT